MRTTSSFPEVYSDKQNTDFQGRGLDNAGKTTIVKKIMGEDVNTVSPTLGFIIKTIDYEGYVLSKYVRVFLMCANHTPGTSSTSVSNHTKQPY